jgi:hypothetical protein
MPSIKSASSQFLPSSAAAETAGGIKSACHRLWQSITATSAGQSWRGESAQVAVPAKVVSIERKLTIFYPIGWMAIGTVACWFVWLAVG